MSLTGLRATSGLATLAVLVFLMPACGRGSKTTPRTVGKPSGGQISIPWDDGAVLQGESEIIKRFGRFERNALWGKMERLARACLDRSDVASERLQGLANWYMARVEGQKIRGQYSEVEERRRELIGRALPLLQKAKKGFNNYQAFLEAKEFYDLHGTEEFDRLIAELKANAETKLRGDYQRAVEAELAAVKDLTGESWPQQLKTVPNEPFWKPGEPSVVVVSRIHHDGLDKLLANLSPRLKGPAPLPLGILFHQFRLGDTGRRQQTANYMERWQGLLGSEVPWTITDRAGFGAIEDLLAERHAKMQELLEPDQKKRTTFTFFDPVVVFLDAQGTPMFHANGVLLEWQLDILLEHLKPLLSARAASASEEKATAPAGQTPPPPEKPGVKPPEGPGGAGKGDETGPPEEKDSSSEERAQPREGKEPKGEAPPPSGEF